MLGGKKKMAVKLSSSYLRYSFQMMAKLNIEKLGAEEAFELACKKVYIWGRRKFEDFFRDMRIYIPKYEGLKEEPFDVKRDGREFGVLISRSQKVFAFRTAHPDEKIAGRIWTTDVEIKKFEEDYFFAVRQFVTSPQSCQEEVPFSCPGLVNDVLYSVGLKDVYQISRKPKKIETREQVEEFLLNLEALERQMPVVLVTPCNILGNAAFPDGYMVDITDLARRLYRIAHVFYITNEMSDYLIEYVDKPWAVYNGAIRTYYPNLNFNTEGYFRHPLLTSQKITEQNQDAKDACIEEIANYVKKYSLARKIPWKEYEIEFYFSEYQRYVENQSQDHAKSRERLDSYEKSLDNCKIQQAQMEAEISSLKQELENLKEKQAYQHQKILWQQDEISELRKKGKTEIRLGKTYDEIPNWIEQYYKDRLFLHSRARRKLKKAVYENVELVYKCLVFLATGYHDYRTHKIDYETLVTQYKKIDAGLELNRSITDNRAGEEGDEYKVDYDNESRTLEWHLKKGNNKDPRMCLRIYFFWDEEDQIVVIGSLPEHLNTRAT